MERVWLRGVPGRGEEVMDLLAKFGGLLDFADYRPATEGETTEFVKRLLAIGKFWNPWTKKMEDLKQVK